MFIFRLNKIVILDNGSIRSGAGIFGHDFANVKFLSFVTPGNIALPNLDDFLRETDSARRAAILQPAVAQVVASRDLTEVSRVTDHAVLTFGDVGYTLYEAEHIPDSFNWTFLAIKSNQGFRDTGDAINEVVRDRGFGAFTDGLATLLTTAAGVANPAYAAGIAIAKFATQIAAQNMMKTGDRELGLVYMSLNRFEHYFHGERKVDNVPDLTRNMTFDYSLFGYERAIPVTPGGD
jgi:hypothetical protein